MTLKTKAQILSDAFSQLRINGLTLVADNADTEMALGRLEDMMAELGLGVSYNFESLPDPNSLCGLPSHANFAISSSLAVRIASDFGKAPEPLLRAQSTSMSALVNRIASPRKVAYPNRMPLGLGNRRHYQNGYYQFMPEVIYAPRGPDVQIINLGEKKILSVDFSEYLAGQDIASYSVDSTSGLTLSAESFSGSSVNLTVLSTKFESQAIEFTVTSTNGQIIKKTLYFNIVEGSPVSGNP